jgi:ribokinase
MAQRMEWDVVVVGGANFDYLVRGPQLPAPGDTVQGKVFQGAPGGKGMNQAVAAARLGARVALVARIGQDERGHVLMTRLREEGIETRYVIRDRGAATGVALVMVAEAGQKQIMVAPGANLHLTVENVSTAEAAIRKTRVVLTQLEVPLESVARAIQLAHEAGAKVILDPAPAVPLPDELLRRVDVLKPNTGEAEVLTEIQVSDRASARKAAEQLLRRGVGAVAIQAGEEGDLLVWREDEQWLPRLPVERVDATGAGDAFAAGLAVALAEGHSWAEAGSWANAAAALKTTKLGAQAGLPQRGEVLALLERIKS